MKKGDVKLVQMKFKKTISKLRNDQIVVAQKFYDKKSREKADIIRKKISSL